MHVRRDKKERIKGSCAVFLSAAALTFFAPALSFAQTAPEGAGVSVLPSVEVIGTFDNPASGRSVMERAVIEKIPAGNGSINELLRLFPDVQVAEEFRTAGDAAEILPPPLSVSGGKIFQNNFLIDGIGNNSLLDPARESLSVNDIPGHPQALFLDAALVETVVLYDSNIPARYGGFTGGVVGARTRDAGPEFGGRLYGRTTRADWTSFHLREGEEDPPDFRKHDVGGEVEIPLGPSSGVLASYRQLVSRLPQRQFGEVESRTRRRENYFLKYTHHLAEGDLRLSFVATPYESEDFLRNIRASRYTLKGGGLQGAVHYDRYIGLGELQMRGSYQSSRNERRAPTDLRAWAVTQSRPWGGELGLSNSIEGGYGDIEKEQESLALAAALLFEPVRLGSALHAVSAGVELETIDGTFARKETTHIYTGARISPDVICGDDDYACIDDEQFFTTRFVHPRSSVSARMTLADLYLEDEVRLKRLLVRPGVRLSYDDFMQNVNLAPRLAATYDLRGGGETLLIAGVNRYYGRSLLTYKLREARRPYLLEYRSTLEGFPTEWVTDAGRAQDVTRTSHLDTPYSDEFTVGVDQSLLQGRLSLKYVRREGKDEFARDYGPRGEDGLRVYTLTNRGRSRHESWRMGWERGWRRHLLSLNVTWQQSEASNESYDETLDEEELSSRVWFEGRLVEKNELPRRDYNRPWTANFLYTGEFPHGLSFTNVTRYRAGYRAIVDTGEDRVVPGGEGRINPFTGETIFEALPVYREERLSGGVVFDWVLGWRIPGLDRLLLTLEVENVFNSRIATGAVGHPYEIGRQFWAGAEYRF